MVTFLVTVTKYLTRHSLKERGFILTSSLRRDTPIIWRKVWLWWFEAAGYIVSVTERLSGQEVGPSYQTTNLTLSDSPPKGTPTFQASMTGWGLSVQTHKPIGDISHSSHSKSNFPFRRLLFSV